MELKSRFYLFRIERSGYWGLEKNSEVVVYEVQIVGLLVVFFKSIDINLFICEMLEKYLLQVQRKFDMQTRVV